MALTTFHAAIDKGIVLKSWDKMVIPLPFARVLVRVGKLIQVPADASDEDLERFTAALQATLDRVCEFSEANVGQGWCGRVSVLQKTQENILDCRF